MFGQKGITQISIALIVLAILGISSYVLLTTVAPFKNTDLNTLNPKKNSYASTTLTKLYSIGGSNVSAQNRIIGSFPGGSFSNGQKFIAADTHDNRVLIYNTVPTNSNAVPDVVVGQVD